MGLSIRFATARDAEVIVDSCGAWPSMSVSPTRSRWRPNYCAAGWSVRPAVRMPARRG